MQFSSRKTSLPSVTPRSDRNIHVDLKFTQTGKYLIAAGSDRPEGQEWFCPVLYISVVGDKAWATHYPLDGKFANDHEAAAAALHYGIQIITRQAKGVLRPDDPRDQSLGVNGRTAEQLR